MEAQTDFLTIWTHFVETVLHQHNIVTFKLLIFIICMLTAKSLVELKGNAMIINCVISIFLLLQLDLLFF